MENTYKVYFMSNGKLDTMFIDATSEQQMKWKLISRVNYAILVKAVIV